MGSVRETYLIVGAGLFGASTALHLIRSSPSAIVILLDRTPFPCPSGASHDLNKIIRAGYDDIFYVKLALEALKLWRSDPIYQPYYHESGMLFSEYWGMGRAAFEHYNTIGEDFDAEMTTPEAAKARFPMFRDANWDDVRENFFDARAGWADAIPCLRNLIQAALEEGVTYIAAPVSTISIVQGTCTGVRLENGRELKADHVLLCTGAHTAKLLADSAPADKELQVNGRLVAAAAVTCAARLAPEQVEKFKDMPVFFNGMDHTHGECIPPTPDGRLKFTYEVSFTNIVHHKKSNQDISVPPKPVGQSTWSQEVPEGLKQEVRTVMRNIFGKEMEGVEPESYRMCWDSVTPNQDFIISPHPKCNRLYIAAGGSFHSWKFMPNIGKYVVQMLQGTLDDEKVRRWAWDRENDGAACVMYIPKRDLKDIPGYDELSGRGRTGCYIL